MKELKLKDSKNKAFIGMDIPKYGGCYLIAEIRVYDTNTFQTDFIRLAGMCSNNIQRISICNYVNGAKIILPEVITEAIGKSFACDTLRLIILGDDIEEIDLTWIAKGLVKRSISKGKITNSIVRIDRCKVHNIVMRETGYTDGGVGISCVDSVVNNVTSI